MNNYDFSNEGLTPSETDGVYKGRTFQDIGGGISGKSVVFQRNGGYPGKNMDDDLWPYSLTDYLKSFIGSVVTVEYVSPSGGCTKKKGRLRVAGTNFIGIQSCRSNSLSLLETGTIKSIDILDCERRQR
ncbi:MAG: hypothetical protein VB064_06485 [Oscillospiraceae bacterium]|nr:hypothetical protein [Oscillospiraceae bacterium]